MELVNRSNSCLDKDQSLGLSGAVQQRQTRDLVACGLLIFVIGIIGLLAFLPPALCCSSLSPTGVQALLILSRISMSLVGLSLACCCGGVGCGGVVC